MWRYVSQCVRDGLRKGAEARCGAGGASGATAGEARGQPLASSSAAHQKETDWCSQHIYDSWLNAFTWSGAVIFGWYTSQIACLRNKHFGWNAQFRKQNLYQKIFFANTKTIHSVVLSHVAFAQPPIGGSVEPSTSISSNNQAPPLEKTISVNNDFKNVVKSIENKLGVSAIDGGNTEEGLALLQSSVDKDHAPAMFNLAVCYEKGIGVAADEKMALELYKSAANHCHPGALYNLAVYYGQGRGGLVRDLNVARDLLRVAAAKGQAEAIEALKTVNHVDTPPVNMTPMKSTSKTSTAALLSMLGCDDNPEPIQLLAT